MIEITHYGPDFEELHCRFAARYWKKRKRVTPEYIYWKFRGKYGQKLNSMILAVEGDKVIGQLGLIPCLVIIEGETIEAQWACELMVDLNYRGKGVAKLLYDYAYTLKPVTLGSDPSPAASVSMKRAGFVGLKGPFKFFFPIYLGEITKLKGINSSFLDKIPNPCGILFSLLNLFGSNSFRQISLGEYRNPKNNDELQAKDELSVLHDENFLNWRFKPYKDYYHGFNLYAGKNNSGFSLYRDKELVLVADYRARQISSLINILRCVVTDARINKAKKIKLMANSRREFWTLLLLGFLPFRTRTEVIFYCANEELKQKMTDKYFRYTFMDSDENI